MKYYEMSQHSAVCNSVHKLILLHIQINEQSIVLKKSVLYLTILKSLSFKELFLTIIEKSTLCAFWDFQRSSDVIK